MHLTGTLLGEKDGHADGAQLDILGDRIIENVVLHVFRSRWDVSLWLPVCFCARRRQISARTGDEGGTLRLEGDPCCRRGGGSAGGIALSQVCMPDEVLVLLLLGTGIGADTWPVALVGQLAADATPRSAWGRRC